MRRRNFLAGLGGGGLGLWQAAVGQDADPLRQPAAAGRSRLEVREADNDEIIKDIERQLKCTCGCNLDIYTCRTTDFACGVSPQLHLEIVELRARGLTPEQVIAEFVRQHGEEVLMAPPAEGFNLAGYLVPGALVLTAGTILAVVLLRRARMAQPAPVSGAGAATSEEITDRDRELLERALSEVAD